MQAGAADISYTAEKAYRNPVTERDMEVRRAYE
jgi:hypothetical protein